MTHNDWEKGATLTIHNATKEQLKFMVRDEQSHSSRLYEQLQTEKAENKKNGETLLSLMTFILENYGKEALAQAMKY